MNRLQAMLTSVQQRFLALPANDRRALLLMFAAILAAVVYLSLSGSARYQRSAIEYYRGALEDMRWMNLNMKLINERLVAGKAPSVVKDPAVGNDGSMLSRITSSAKPFGIVFKRYQPEDENGLRLWIENASFDALMQWFSALEQQQIVLEQLDIDRLPKASGMVNARLLLLEP